MACYSVYSVENEGEREKKVAPVMSSRSSLPHLSFQINHRIQLHGQPKHISQGEVRDNILYAYERGQCSQLNLQFLHLIAYLKDIPKV